MTVRELTEILKQFDPDRNVVLELDVHVFGVRVYPWEDDGYFHNYCTDVRKGDIAIEPIGRR